MIVEGQTAIAISPDILLSHPTMGSILFIFLVLVLGFFIFTRRGYEENATFLFLSKHPKNPLLSPRDALPWEAEAVFNPAAFYADQKVHLLYRAVGPDGVSRVGYASSTDGVHFERLAHPVYEPGPDILPSERHRYKYLFYSRDRYASGGSWGGAEDPRAVVIDQTVFMSFGLFENWDSMRLAVTTLPLENLRSRLWHWSEHIAISPKNERNKNWVLFPEKINGRFAILHALTPQILIEYVDSLEHLRYRPIRSNNNRSGREGYWDSFVRGAGPPPIKTNEGWLLLYHAVDRNDPDKYKLGAMILDISDPSKILYRSNQPILSPDEWYENEGKPGVVYACGAVVMNDTLFVYYGGGDRVVCVATAPLKKFTDALIADSNLRSDFSVQSISI